VNVAAILVKNRAEIDPTTKVCLFRMFVLHTSKLIRCVFMVSFTFYPFSVRSKAGIDRPAGVDRPSSYCVIYVNGAQRWKLSFLA
jgi:hypothetical protein